MYAKCCTQVSLRILTRLFRYGLGWSGMMLRTIGRLLFGGQVMTIMSISPSRVVQKPHAICWIGAEALAGTLGVATLSCPDDCQVAHLKKPSDIDNWSSTLLPVCQLSRWYLSLHSQLNWLLSKPSVCSCHRQRLYMKKIWYYAEVFLRYCPRLRTTVEHPYREEPSTNDNHNSPGDKTCINCS